VRPIPGLAGFLMSRDRGMAEDAAEQKQALTLQAILEKRQEAQRQKAYDTDMGALGPDATMEQRVGVAARHVRDPKEMLKIGQGALDKQMVNDTKLHQLGLQSQFEDLKHEARMTKLTREEDKLAEIARHNKAMESIAEMKALIAGTTGQERSPYWQYLPTDKGYVAANTRDPSQVSTVTINGQPIVRATDSPRLQGQIAGAREGGQAQAKRDFNMQGIGAIIKQAEDVLGGKQKPTGSGFGTAVDTVTGLVGISPKGAAEADQLRAIGGALVGKMPRMEGPQSDRDVQLYREMAAQVGDSTIPVERRKAALEVVKSLWQKYERLNPDAFAAPAATPAAPAAAPAQVQRGTSKSGKPIIFRNGRWEYE
jgi:hypothetical protein